MVNQMILGKGREYRRVFVNLNLPSWRRRKTLTIAEILALLERRGFSSKPGGTPNPVLEFRTSEWGSLKTQRLSREKGRRNRVLVRTRSHKEGTEPREAEHSKKKEEENQMAVEQSPELSVTQNLQWRRGRRRLRSA